MRGFVYEYAKVHAKQPVPNRHSTGGSWVTNAAAKTGDPKEETVHGCFASTGNE